MPLDTFLVILAITMIFATFAIILAWGGRQTVKQELRRPFW